MTTTLQLRNRSDVLAAVPTVLGFTPEDSLVVIGLGTGVPHARLDMPHTDADVVLTRMALLPAVEHWAGHDVLVIGYTDDADRFDALDWDQLLPGVRVDVAFLAGDAEPTPDLPGLADLPKPEANRAALVRQASRVRTAKGAVRRAWESYRSGDGARAWCYLDRAKALGASEEEVDELAALLFGAVNPRTVEEVSV